MAGETYYALGVLYELAAIWAYPNEYASFDGSMIAFWATRDRQQREHLKTLVNRELQRAQASGVAEPLSP